MQDTFHSFNDCVGLDIRLSEHRPELSGQRIVPKHAQDQDEFIQVLDQADVIGHDWMAMRVGSSHPKCRS
jgi:hypothetical protein